MRSVRVSYTLRRHTPALYYLHYRAAASRQLWPTRISTRATLLIADGFAASGDVSADAALLMLPSMLLMLLRLLIVLILLIVLLTLILLLTLIVLLRLIVLLFPGVISELCDCLLQRALSRCAVSAPY